MALVRLRVLHGKQQLAAPLRPFASEATIGDVVSKALGPFHDHTCVGLAIFKDEGESSAKKTEIDVSDFANICLGDVEGMGLFWVAQVERAGGGLDPIDGPWDGGEACSLFALEQELQKDAIGKTMGRRHVLQALADLEKDNKLMYRHGKIDLV